MLKLSVNSMAISIHQMAIRTVRSFWGLACIQRNSKKLTPLQITTQPVRRLSLYQYCSKQSEQQQNLDDRALSHAPRTTSSKPRNPAVLRSTTFSQTPLRLEGYNVHVRGSAAYGLRPYLSLVCSLLRRESSKDSGLRHGDIPDVDIC